MPIKYRKTRAPRLYASVIINRICDYIECRLVYHTMKKQNKLKRSLSCYLSKPQVFE